MKILLLNICLCATLSFFNASGQEPVRIGIAGLSHSHVLSLLRNTERKDIQIVGISEEDTALANRYIRQFSLDNDIVFESLEAMVEETRPEGVVVFTSIYDHKKVVEICSPRGIHIMVEKPLAVNLRHARKMSRITLRNGTFLLTNYETTWYPSNHAAYEMHAGGELGNLRRVIVYDGHTGPKEIEVNEEFLVWLTDPVLNGGGAVTDFGCYGADLMTWLLNGQKPEWVTAVLKSYKPEIYPRVDDDATIILTYPNTECVIHASWNWPFNRKDMHIYGTKGYVFCDDANTIRFRCGDATQETRMEISSDRLNFNDPFSYFAAVIRGEVTVDDDDPSSLDNNITVVAILDAAKRSSKKGRRVKLR